ncbi:MAG: PP2C family protein-serine/threonine phosphatase [Sphingobacteriaceae bacterium]
MKNLGKGLLITGLTLIVLIILDLTIFNILEDNGKAIFILLTLLGLFCISISIPVIYFNSSPKKMTRVIFITALICTLILAFAIYSKMNSYAGAAIEFILGLLFFSFSVLPLVIKKRFDARKHLFNWKQIVLSFADLISIALIILSVLFKIMHWPGASAMMIIGSIGFIITMIFWNRTFSKEVMLRHDAEQKLKHAFVELEEKNKEILDSINYAQRIQKALLASTSLLNKNLPEHFVLFNPKDIVSGDFYWATPAHNKFYFIVADSTGHGVPGAFMSLLNISFLNEAINERGIDKPNEILAHVRKRLIESLAIEGVSDGGNDGMDCSLMAFDFKTNTLEVTCANNPLLILRDNEIIEIAADKIPVGKSLKNEQNFTLHTLQLQKEDVLFAFTDGFADQFGGPKGKKFKYKQLCEVLNQKKNLPLSSQKEILLNLFNQWKGNLEQVDDVLLVGIKIN